MDGLRPSINPECGIVSCPGGAQMHSLEKRKWIAMAAFDCRNIIFSRRKNHV